MTYAKRVLVVICCLAIVGVASGCDKEKATDGEATATAPKEEAKDKEASAPEDKAEKQGGSPTTLEELPEGVNAVQNEMRLLNTAMQNTLTLIANNQLEGIPAQIKKVHPARQLTAKAIEKGVYKTPVNADQMDKFVELDNKFHDDLKGLLKASKTDDLKMATDKYGDLVQGCTNCHTQFRFEQPE